MRAVAIGLFVLAACATRPEPDEPGLFTLDGDLAGGGSVPVGGDTAWQAACRAMAWDGGYVRADPAHRRVGVDDALEVVLWPGQGRATCYCFIADTGRGGDVAWERFHRRFLQAIELLESGRTLPLDPPPLPPESA